MLLKRESRFIGFDDAPFEPHSRGSKVPIIGVVMRAGEYIEGILREEVTVDGRDANEVLERMLLSSRFLSQIKCILLDGIAFGGFNVIDIFRLSERTGIPVISLTRNSPDMDSIFTALERHFEDGKERSAIVRRGVLHEFPVTSQGITYVLHGKFAGIDRHEAGEILNMTINRGAYPEPLRIAHMIGSAMVKGESKGRA
jgi:uncharacterized protein